MHLTLRGCFQLLIFFGCMQILRSHCHNEDDYSCEAIDEVNANTLMVPFCPSEEPDACQVTMTSAIRLVNRFLLTLLMPLEVFLFLCIFTRCQSK